MPETKGHSGGKREGAGRKRTRPTMQVELPEQATRELLDFLEDLNLDRAQLQQYGSVIVLAALTEDKPKWAERFGNE